MQLPKKTKRYFRATKERCHRVRITHLIDKSTLIFVVYYHLYLEDDGWVFRHGQDTLSKKTIGELVESGLKYQGQEFLDEVVDSVSEYANDGKDSEAKEKWEHAIKLVRQLFPYWFINDNSLRFIEEKK